jgi:hypothetical protein
MNYTTITTHGFRSCFADWCGEIAGVEPELAEMALAHAIKDPTRKAYRRGDALERRHPVMEAWAQYLEPKPAGSGSETTWVSAIDDNADNVVAFPKVASA